MDTTHNFMKVSKINHTPLLQQNICPQRKHLLKYIKVSKRNIEPKHTTILLEVLNYLRRVLRRIITLLLGRRL